MPRPRPNRSHGAALAGLLALALAACGTGEREALRAARLHLDHGSFEAAEATLRGLEGSPAEELRKQIADARLHRASIERELAEIREQALARGESWTRTEIAELLAAERDPGSVERIEQAQSDLASALAEHRTFRSASAGDGALDEPLAAAPAPARSDALADVLEARARSQWRLALSLADRAAAADAALAGDARLARESVLAEARVEAELLIGRARDLERSGDAPGAARLLAPELTRFPEGGEFARLRNALDGFVQRSPPAARGALASAAIAPLGTTVEAALARAQSADECAALAQSYAGRGDWRSAGAAWHAAAGRRPEPPWPEQCERRARECDLRLALREELTDFARVDGATSALLGGEGLEQRWGTLALADLWSAAERAKVSTKARLGWCVEAIARGSESEREFALARLGEHVQRDELDRAHASMLVARATGKVADGGWVFRGGRWQEGTVAELERESAEREARAAKAAQLAGEFRRAGDAERDVLWTRLREQGDPELTNAALAARWSDDCERLERNANLRQLAQLADDRRELDAAREKALALIFDEERYFYPYNPPECPPQKAATYAAVQREVDVLVLAVRAVLEGSKRVRIGDGLRRDLATAAWTSARASEVELALAPPAEISFAFHLPAGHDVGLLEFAWDEAERARLDKSERIGARNERLWSAQDGARPSDSVPSSEEREQVRITNAYRRLLGRGALAWNPRIEAAAQGHSDHMANTGDFSHFEQGDPARRTPTDRLKLAGYDRGVSENISMGRGDPKSAHEGWMNSSGHHRNLLMPGHREMASALASSYWTQNFGTDDAFLADL